MMLKQFAILFDLDGTLIDSSEGIIDAYQHMLNELGLTLSDPNSIRQFIGPSIYEVLRTRFGLTGEIVDHAVLMFRQRYKYHGIFKYRKYEGIDEMISTLSDEGFFLSIATSKLEQMAQLIVDNAGWSHQFSHVNGSDFSGRRITKQDVIERSQKRLPNGVNALAMVGDTSADLIASRNVGIVSIGVTWGFGTVEALSNSGAKYIVTKPREIFDIAAAIRESAIQRRH